MAQIAEDKELVISREFDAPRALVWKAWSEPERLARWWGPKDYVMGAMTLDFRPGGVFHYSMRSPDGVETWGKFTYRQIVAPECIVFASAFSDAEGGTVRSPLGPTWPLEILNTLTFTEQKGKTTLVLRGGPIDATEEELKAFEAARPSIEKGFAGTWERLDAELRR